MSQFTKFQIQALDGGVYEVDAPEPAIVFTLMVSSRTEGKLLDMADEKAQSISVAGRPLSTDEAWSVVKENSWPLLGKVCESLVVIRQPWVWSANPNSLDGIVLLKEEAARRARSRWFEKIAAACAN